MHVPNCFCECIFWLIATMIVFVNSYYLSLIGARRFVTLDFGRPILLTDVLIPTCGDLASLSIDIWTLGEEVDGRRLVVATDISTHSLILHDLIPPPVCRFMKVKICKTVNWYAFHLSNKLWEILRHIIKKYNYLLKYIALNFIFANGCVCIFMFHFSLNFRSLSLDVMGVQMPEPKSP